MATIINNRYEVLSKLGSGGMGSVYKVHDRLTDKAIALKQVNANATDLEFASRASMNDTDDFRLGLALEFRTLASLRHPQIVSVLDYGFDESGQPYFTMQLIDSAKELTDYAATLSDEKKVELLVAVLQALSYLHRRGILHRDLKPPNVLVNADGQVKVMDFGLALHRGDSVTNLHESGVGTLAYMAPELFADEPATIQSDLYAVGVMAYELFVGKHPFKGSNMMSLIMSIARDIPDTTSLPYDLADFLDKLLSKTANERFDSAEACIRELCKATDFPVPEENASQRASYLQAARFVGRDTELKTLLESLKNTLDNQGTFYLLGGESGVGKSRLVEELRSRALVDGAIVFRGQGSDGVGTGWDLWRDVLPPLVLASTLEDLEYWALETVLPNLSRLSKTPSERTAIPPDSLDALIEQSIVDMLLRLDKPVLLLLDDVQWAQEQLSPLTQLSEKIDTQSLMIVASYRDDEAPDLPEQFPAATLLPLKRLDDNSIQELSVSMLGTIGQDGKLVSLLQRETEGNVFFMVEVLRALAEEAGSLNDITSIELPQSILTGGVRSVVQRRLNRLPDIVQLWLKPIAIIGRQLDIALIDHISENFLIQDITKQLTGELETNPVALGVYKSMVPTVREEFLIICSNASVLEAVGENWQFSHDKIRETIIADLSGEERRIHSSNVADAIEQTYPDTRSYYPKLVTLFQSAGRDNDEARYIEEASLIVSQNGNINLALDLANRALELIPSSVIALNVKAYAMTWIGSPEFDRILSLYNRVLEIAPRNEDAMAGKAFILRRKAEKIGIDDPASVPLFDEAEQIFTALLDENPDHVDFYGESWWGILGGLYKRRGKTDKAIHAYTQVTRVTPHSSYGYINLAQLYGLTGDMDKMLSNYRMVAKTTEQEIVDEAKDASFWTYVDFIISHLALGKAEIADAKLQNAFELAPLDSPFMLNGLLITLKNLHEILLDERQLSISNIIKQVEDEIANRNQNTSE